MTTTIEDINNVNINAWRNGYKWSVNECLRLEREYDLLELSVPDMAILHKRTLNAIMFKLQAEGLDTFNNLYFKTYGQDFINDQIDKLNNLCSDDLSENEDEDDEDLSEDDDEDYEDLSEDEDEDDDEDYEDLSNEALSDDGSNKAYVFEQVKSIHKHINNLLAYFKSGTSQSTKHISANACI
jgi:hypothetical protein